MNKRYYRLTPRDLLAAGDEYRATSSRPAEWATIPPWRDSDPAALFEYRREIKLSDGHRFLDPGETVQPGDKYFLAGQWYTTSVPGLKVIDGDYCRAIEAPLRSCAVGGKIEAGDTLAGFGKVPPYMVGQVNTFGPNIPREVKLPDGHRFLDRGELVEDGDQWFSEAAMRWCRAFRVGEKAEGPYYCRLKAPTFKVEVTYGSNPPAVDRYRKLADGEELVSGDQVSQHGIWKDLGVWSSPTIFVRNEQKVYRRKIRFAPAPQLSIPGVTWRYKDLTESAWSQFSFLSKLARESRISDVLKDQMFITAIEESEYV